MTGLPRLLLDVTQWAYWPATTGIQRVLGHLAARWAGEEVEASFGVLEDDRYVVGPLASFAPVVRSRFEDHQSGDRAAIASSVVRELRTESEAVVPADRLADVFSGYLLPEPTLRADSLSVLATVGSRSSVVPFALYYDALPMTHPESFPRNADAGGTVTRYHRAVARIENVAFISHHTRRVFETRIARRRLQNALVAAPGADALSTRWQSPPDTPRFSVVGTVEPRKRYPLVLDVFERLWAAGRSYELVILGAAAWEQPTVFERLEHLSGSWPLRWVRDADDEEVLDALSSSTALLFLSEAEGYGLPPMEALSVGCPIIVSQDLPALEGIAPGGQVRLRSVGQQPVYAAVERLADPVVNARYRTAIQALELPTWDRFARDIEHWVARRLGANSSRLVA